jgi:hypothetical protein
VTTLGMVTSGNRDGVPTMDEATRQAVELLEYVARPSFGLDNSIAGAIQTVLSALEAALEDAQYYREDRRKWKEATLFQRYSMTKPSAEEYERIGRFVVEHPSLENAVWEDGQE